MFNDESSHSLVIPSSKQKGLHLDHKSLKDLEAAEADTFVDSLDSARATISVPAICSMITIEIS